MDQDAAAAAFEAQCTALTGGSPVQKLFRRLLMPPHLQNKDPSCATLDLHANAEMMRWPLERQRTAMTLLRFNSVVTTAKLGQLQLTDDVAGAIAGVWLVRVLGFLLCVLGFLLFRPRLPPHMPLLSLTG